MVTTEEIQGSMPRDAQVHLRLRRCIRYAKGAHSSDNICCVVTAKTQYSLKNCVGDYYNEGERVADGRKLDTGRSRPHNVDKFQAGPIYQKSFAWPESDQLTAYPNETYEPTSSDSRDAALAQLDR
jgi:hypothetical protein